MDCKVPWIAYMENHVILRTISSGRVNYLSKGITITLFLSVSSLNDDK